MGEALYIFHYNGTSVELDILEPNVWYFDKPFEFIKNDEVAAFFIYCEDILNDANPSYGFNYNGSYFKEDGRYFSSIEDYQFMTCVGFCLNVITGAIENHSYILHEEWEMADHEKDIYFQEHMDSLLNSVSREKRKLIKKNQRRIYPIEYFTSSFIDAIPISKKSIEEVLPTVNQAISELIAS